MSNTFHQHRTTVTAAELESNRLNSTITVSTSIATIKHSLASSTYTIESMCQRTIGRTAMFDVLLGERHWDLNLNRQSPWWKGNRTRIGGPPICV